MVANVMERFDHDSGSQSRAAYGVYPCDFFLDAESSQHGHRTGYSYDLKVGKRSGSYLALEGLNVLFPFSHAFLQRIASLDCPSNIVLEIFRQ
jgi:hypothetical protein